MLRITLTALQAKHFNVAVFEADVYPVPIALAVCCLQDACRSMATIFTSSVQGQEAISIEQMLTVGQACEHLFELHSCI